LYFVLAPCHGVLSSDRYDEYKAHYLTEGSWNSVGQDPACGALLQHQDPPLLFNLEHDPGERLPLDPAQYPEVRRISLFELNLFCHYPKPFFASYLLL
jgi:hypothetical protein